MKAILQSQSTLTDRYQTTIPEPVREALHLHKRDKICYNILKNGSVVIYRASEYSEVENDPVISNFLAFLAKDMQNNPKHIKVMDAELVKRAKALVDDVEFDLDAPLDAADE